MTVRKKTLFWLIIGWLALETANWVLNEWLSTNVNVANLAKALPYLKAALLFLTNGFGLGFVLGAAVFSVWDWPFVGMWIKKRRERARNKDADESLAQECDEISLELYENAVQIERIRNERHWESASKATSEDIHKSWIEARTAETREEERIRRKIGHRIQNTFLKLQGRGIKMDLWGFSLSHYDLSASSYFFADIANSLRTGNYLDKEFKAGHSGTPSRI